MEAKVSTPKTLKVSRAREQTHETRDFDTYVDANIHIDESTPWVKPSSLEAPEPRPGMTQRWIRVAFGSESDPTNVARKFREGWKPRLASTVPASYQPPTIAHGKYTGCVGVEGMLLCEIPSKLLAKKRTALRQKTDGVNEAIEAELQAQSNRNAPIRQERSSKVVREVAIQDD